VLPKRDVEFLLFWEEQAQHYWIKPSVGHFNHRAELSVRAGPLPV